MKNFYFYTIITLLIYFIDYKFNLNNLLVIIFYIATLVFSFSKKEKIRKNIFGTNYKCIILYVILFIFSFAILSNFLIYLIFRDSKTVMNIDEYDFIYILKSLIIFPLLEESVYRGYLFSNLLLTSKKKATLLVSFGFLLIHLFSNSSPILVFSLSVFICYIYAKTKSLFLCIVAHILNNIIVVFFFPFLIHHISNQKNNYLIILFMIILVSFSLFKIINKKMKDVR